jgi:citrate lyase beta subunit
MLDNRSIRSIMFTPALRVDRFHQALESDADVCLLDMEDSVGITDKNKAREMLCNFLAEPITSTKPFAIRINAIGTHDGTADITALNNSPRVPNYVVIPKAETPADIISAANLLECHARGIGLIALIETIKGVQNVEAIASASSNLSALLFGAADYTRAIEGEICWDTLLHARTMIIHAACNNNIGAIDTPFFDIRDLHGLSSECKRVKMLGFTGRCAIHPSQISIINKMFSHSTHVIEQAKRIISAARESKGNIFQVDGKMVGTPIINQALKILKINNIIERN